MSLTRFLRDKNFQEARNKLKAIFPNPRVKFTQPLLAIPTTDHHHIIGNAFDYMLRFMIKYKNGDKAQSLGLVANSGYSSIKNRLSSRNSALYRISIDAFESKYKHSKEAVDLYLKNGQVTDEVVKAVLFYGRLDVTSRTGDIDENLLIDSLEEIQDMHKIVSLVKDSDFKVKNMAYLNPTFGKGSGTVGGADADLIIDDLLIDIKCTKNLSLEREYLNQIFCYYIMSLIGGVNGDENIKPVKRIGIYFSRYGLLWTIPVSSICSERAINEFKEWFVEYTNNKIWNNPNLQPYEAFDSISSSSRVASFISERQRLKMMESEWGRQEVAKYDAKMNKQQR